MTPETIERLTERVGQASGYEGAVVVVGADDVRALLSHVEALKAERDAAESMASWTFAVAETALAALPPPQDGETR